MKSIICLITVLGCNHFYSEEPVEGKLISENEQMYYVDFTESPIHREKWFCGDLKKERVPKYKCVKEK